MFKSNQAKHLQIMAELRALEAKEAGIDAAYVVPAPKDKLSLGKALMFLGGLSAMTWFLVFSDKSPFESTDSPPSDKKKTPKEGAESYEILNQIKYGEMDNVKEKQHLLEQKPRTPDTSKGFLDAALSRASLLSGGK